MVIRQTTDPRAELIDDDDDDEDSDTELRNNLVSEDEITNIIGDDELNDEDRDNNDTVEFLSTLDLKTFTSHQVQDNKFCLKIGEKLIKKSTLVWFFSNKKGRLSTDRLLRVRGMSSSINTVEKKEIEIKRKQKKMLKQDLISKEGKFNQTIYSILHRMKNLIALFWKVNLSVSL